MNTEKFYIGSTPARLYGAGSGEGAFLFIHGKNGSKDDAEVLAEVLCGRGYSLTAIDLPGHGESGEDVSHFNPWDVLPIIRRAVDYVSEKSGEISLCANSIGAYFSMNALEGCKSRINRAFFVSPIVDMEKLIDDMMGWAGVDEDELRRRGEIPTNFGETLSYEYLSYVRAHPIHWMTPTNILYAGGDSLTSRDTVRNFAEKCGAQLTVMENGEHWFHTEEQLEFLKSWIREKSQFLRG